MILRILRELPRVLSRLRWYTHWTTSDSSLVRQALTAITRPWISASLAPNVQRSTFKHHVVILSITITRPHWARRSATPNRRCQHFIQPPRTHSQSMRRYAIIGLLASLAGHVALSVPTSTSTATKALSTYGKWTFARGKTLGTYVGKMIVWCNASGCMMTILYPELELETLCNACSANIGQYCTAVLLWSCRLTQHRKWTYTTLVGAGFLLAGAALQLSARARLGSLTTSPLIKYPDGLLPSRLVHIPQLHPPNLVQNRLKSLLIEDSPTRETVSLLSGHVLVQDGPYRYLRHPMYTAYTLGLVGLTCVYLPTGFLLGLQHGHPWWKPMPAVLMALMSLQSLKHLYDLAHLEELALFNRHGKQWTMYTWRTPVMFLPGLY